MLGIFCSGPRMRRPRSLGAKDYLKSVLVFSFSYVGIPFSLCSLQEPKKLKKLESQKRPSGMNREVYALLYADRSDK